MGASFWLTRVNKLPNFGKKCQRDHKGSQDHRGSHLLQVNGNFTCNGGITGDHRITNFTCNRGITGDHRITIFTCNGGITSDHSL